MSLIDYSGIPNDTSLAASFAQNREQFTQNRPDIASQLPPWIVPTFPGNPPTEIPPGASTAAPSLSAVLDWAKNAAGASIQGPGGKPGKPEDVQAAQQVITQGTTPGKAPLIGYDWGGLGEGIMGTGIQPLDVLAFALGAAMTSRLPQAQAMEATFAIAGFPRRLREAQAKAAEDSARTQLAQFRALTLRQTAEREAQKQAADDAVLAKWQQRIADTTKGDLSPVERNQLLLDVATVKNFDASIANRLASGGVADINSALTQMRGTELQPGESTTYQVPGVGSVTRSSKETSTGAETLSRSGLSQVAKDVVAEEAVKRGMDIADALKNPEIITKAVTESQKQREADRAIRQGSLNLAVNRDVRAGKEIPDVLPQHNTEAARLLNGLSANDLRSPAKVNKKLSELTTVVAGKTFHAEFAGSPRQLLGWVAGHRTIVPDNVPIKWVEGAPPFGPAKGSTRVQ